MKKFAAAIVLVLSTAAASAGTYDLGILSNPINLTLSDFVKDGRVVAMPDGFDVIKADAEATLADNFTFSLAGPSFANVTGEQTVVFKGTSGPAIRDIAGFYFGLYTQSGNVVVPASMSTDAMSLSFGLLSAGSYMLKFWGSPAGTKGGYYNGTISVAAVPEPETYAMFLAGLGLIGGIARRRKQTA